MHAIVITLGLYFMVGAGSASAEERYDGIWGDVNHGCRSEEHRMGIRGDRFQWYETSCRARRLSGTGNAWKFEMNCSGEGQKFRTVTSLSLPSPDRLVMENAPVGPNTGRQVYKRCPRP